MACVKWPCCCLFRGVPWGGEGDYLFGSLSDKCLDRMLGTDCMSLTIPWFPSLGFCLMWAPLLARIVIHGVVDTRTVTVAHIGRRYWNGLYHSRYS